MGKIYDININFAGNGSPHTASISTVESTSFDPRDGSVSNIGEFMANIGDTAQALFSDGNNSQLINNLLQKFKVQQVTTSVDPYKRTKQYQLVDEISIILDKTIVLLRGEQFGPFNVQKGSGNVYQFSQDVFDACEIPSANTFPKDDSKIVEQSDKEVEELNENIIVMGRARSTFEPSGSFGDINIRTGRISSVYEGGAFLRNMSLGAQPSIEMIKQQVDNVSLKYGYTIGDLIKALKIKKLNVDGLENFDDVFMDSSGQLRAVISSAASLLGLYWSVDLQTNTIKFVNSSELDSLNKKVVLESGNTSIISSSLTESGPSPLIVASYNGSTSGINEKNKSTTTIKGGGVSFQQTSFYRFRTERFFQDEDLVRNFEGKMLGPYFSLFNRYEVNEEQFNLYTLALLLTKKEEGEDEFTFGAAYDDNNLDRSQQGIEYGVFKVEYMPNSSDPLRESKIKGRTKNGKFYKLGYKNEDGNAEATDKPSINLYEFFKKIYPLFSNFYISKPFLKQNILNKYIECPSLTLTGPYPVNTNINQIDDFEPIKDLILVAETLGFDLKDTTLKDILKKREYLRRGDINQDWDDDDDNTLNEKWVYLGSRDFKPLFSGSADGKYDPSLAKRVIESSIAIVDNGSDKYLFISNDASLEKQLGNMYKDSVSLYDTFITQGVNNTTITISQENQDPTEIKDVLITDRIIGYIKYATESESNGQSGGGGQPQTESASPDLKFNNVFHKLFFTSEKDNLGLFGKSTSSELRQFSGSVGEMRVLSELINLPKPINLRQSQVEYYGLILPTEYDITLDSISITVGDRGLQTSISRSTKSSLQIDQQLILSQNRQAVIVADTSKKLNAVQKNLLRI